MRWVKFLAVFILMVLLFSVGPGMARADAPDYTNPAVAQFLSAQLAKAGDKASDLWATYPSEAKRAVIRYNTVVKFARSKPQNRGAVTPLASGCLAPTEGITGYNYLGWPMFSFYVQINYCYDGQNITSHWGHVWGTTNYPGSAWTYNGVSSWNQSGGDGQSYYHYYAEGSFSFCPAGYCVQWAHPWVWLTVYGTGGIPDSDTGFH